MTKKKFTGDFWVQFGILILTLLALLAAQQSRNEDHFATKTELHSARDEISVERDERRELKGEIDAMYSLIVPPTQRHPLAHPQPIGEKE